MKLNQKLFFSVFFLMITFSLFSQNALYPPDLIIRDEIVVDENLEFPFETNFIKHYLNEDLSDQTISELIWKKLTTKDFDLYSWFFLPEYASFDIFNISQKEDLSQLFNVENKSQLVNIDHMIRSVAFFDKWFLDAEKFILSKEVVGYCPIRLHQRQKDVTGYAPIHRIPSGIIRFPEEKRKQYSLSGNKNLIPVKKIAYEFLMINEYKYKAAILSDDFYFEDASFYSKEFNSLWGEFQAKKIVDVIFDQISYENRKIYDLYWDHPADIKQIAEELFAWEYEFTDPDPYVIIVDEEYIANDLKGNIYSLIFFEEWSLDTSSLFIHKNVTSVAPVYWKTEINESTGEVYVDESTGDPVYTKIPLFRIDFNLPDLTEGDIFSSIELINPELSLMEKKYENFNQLIKLTYYPDGTDKIPPLGPQKNAKQIFNGLIKIKSLEYLSLPFNNLIDIPAGIKDLTRLQELYLSNNNLDILQDEICSLKNLKKLDLSNNNLVLLPDCIGQLEKLEILDISGNYISELPESMKNLKNLKILNMDPELIMNSLDLLEELGLWKR